MVRRAFPAEVTNGQLRFDEPLTDLEGRRVMVVLDECEFPSQPRPRLTPNPLSVEEVEPIPEAPRPSAAAWLEQWVQLGAETCQGLPASPTARDLLHEARNRNET